MYIINVKGVDNMIVTSKRCYLNIITQFTDLQTLLNANYYMADVRTPDGNVHLGDSLRYDEYGQLVIENAIEPSLLSPAIGKYNIKYGSGELDPTPYITNVLVGIGETYADPHKRFIEHLNSTDTMIATYNYLFRNELRGNGVQILIFSDDSLVEEGFVHIVCGYLAQNFGCDIDFIDPMFRPNVKGQTQYKGDKEFAKKNIKDIRDAQLLIDFNQTISAVGSDECVNNLTTFLGNFDIYQIMYLYNLLFPEAPLPPDNYTKEHIMQIIIGRVSSQIPKNPFSNLMLSDDYLEMIARYEAEEMDFDQDEDY